jgi:CBS domain-containing protein
MASSVKAHMSGDPVAVSRETRGSDAFRLMADRGIRHLPVVDAHKRVVGVISRGDLARDPRGAKLVEELMSPDPETVREGTPLGEAADRMADRRIGCLPVVDASGRLTGLISETDVLRALATMLSTRHLRRE